MRSSGKEEGLSREENKIRNRQWAHASSPLRLPPPFSFPRGVGMGPYGPWPNHVGRLQRVCSFILVIACLPLARLTRRCSRRASWLLVPAFIMLSHQCRYDHPRPTTSMGTSDPFSALARCLGSVLFPSPEPNGSRPLTLLPFSGSSIRSLLGDLYK
jgi:hypothetical protein